MHRPTLTLNFTAGGAIAARRIVRAGAADGAVAQAGAGTETPIGVSGELGAVNGARVDVHLVGVVNIEAGGAVERGAPLASDSDGRAVAATASSHTAVLDGAGANADIAVAGIAAGDEIAAVIELAADATAVVSRTAASSIKEAGKITCTTSTTGKKLLVSWRRPSQAVGIALAAATADGDIIPVLLAPRLI